MIAFHTEQPSEEDEWPDIVAELVRRGEEKRKRRISSGRAKQKLPG
jgi:hypothetical protein